MEEILGGLPRDEVEKGRAKETATILLSGVVGGDYTARPGRCISTGQLRCGSLWTSL